MTLRSSPRALTLFFFVTLSLPSGCRSRSYNAVKAPVSNALSQASKSESNTVGEFGESWSALRTLRDTSALDGGDDEKPTPDGWWVTPIHTNLLPDGRVLVTGWARRDEKKCELLGTRRYGRTFILDPKDFSSDTLSNAEKNFTITPIPENPLAKSDVLYCAGHLPLGGGKVLFAGGSTYENLGLPGKELEYGLNSFRVFDGKSPTLTRPRAKLSSGPQGMEGWAWYPTLTRLADGKVLLSNGYARCCAGKYYNYALHKIDPAKIAADDPSAVSVFVPHDIGYRDTAPGLRDYTHTFLLARPVDRGGHKRDVLQAGWPGKMILLDTTDSTPQNERFFKPDRSDRPSGSGWDSSALLASTGEVVTLGGTSNPSDSAFADFYSPDADSWDRVDFGIGRRNPTGVLLPDGHFLVMNGEDGDRPFPGDRKRAQIFDPFSRGLTTLAPWPGDSLERGYHSWALLLKDGRILLGGGISAGGGVGCERTDVRIFVPPYLDPRRGARPRISGLAEGTQWKTGGQAATLSVDDAGVRSERGFALLALGAVTHAFDQNQRYVALSHSKDASGRYVVNMPSDGHAAPPGDYMLFAISDKGTPSVGVHVVVGP